MSKTEYANPEELAVEADTSVIPSFAMTLVEQSMYVAESTERDYNALMESIGVEEISIYESTGEEVVYEGASFANLKEKFIRFFQALWARIKGLYDRLLKEFEKKHKEQMEKLSAPVDLSKLKDVDESKYNKVKIHKFEGLDDAIDKIGNNCNSLLDAVNNYKAANDGTDTLGFDVVKKLTSGVADVNGGSLTEVAKEIKDKLYGEVFNIDYNWVNSNWNKVKDIVISGKDFKKDIRAGYKANKKVIDKIIKQIKGYKSDDTAELEAFKRTVDYFKDVSSACNTITNAVIDVAKRRCSEYSMVIHAINRASKAYTDKKEDSTNESVDPAIKLGTTQKDLIEASFDW